jgi:hypothetical protein
MSSGLLSGNGSGVRGLFNEEHGKGTRKGGTIVEPFPSQTERQKAAKAVADDDSPPF